MGWRSRIWAAGALLASVAILAVGWARIEDRIRERPTIRDDDELTVDELANVPPGTLRVVVPRTASSTPDALPYRVLRLALEASGRPFVMGYARLPGNQEMAVQRLAASPDVSSDNPAGLTVGFFGAGPELHRRLRPVPVPVLGGLLGLRGLWVNRSRRDRLASSRLLEDLQGLVVAQGTGWSDARLMAAAGLRTFEVEPDLLFELLNENRIDMIPRGLPELGTDHLVVERRYPRVELDDHLLLAYPFAMMFYVHPSQDELASALDEGLRRAIADGRYQALLEKAMVRPWLRRRLNLRERRIVELPNPGVDALLEDVPDDVWIVPWDDLGPLTSGEQLCDRPVLSELC
ncbi:hypothetical protein EVJ50_05950 [Synechococcus sp. RSCCF101]|uniref:amino acid ABC transporter substrate-binding protein n=1 Tax=Synechococcus sp. RSCCF101 TaxID=2511069 RepID=UPI001248AA9D|nr:amino acid ABC transporter substrate-binding protein [Synechococcus sp. RSCCF101]QEY31853.1 hypothetical protein EVJ50_05950 [Synechococcus sp. RSCCF101]